MGNNNIDLGDHRIIVPGVVLDNQDPLKVAVLFAAFTILVAVTAAAKEALLFKVNTSNEVVPTIPVTDADADPSVNVRSRAVLSLSIVAPKVMLLSVVVNITSLLNTTAPEYV